MRFTELPPRGAYIIELDRIADERGFFARSYCRREYEQLKLDANIVQINNSFNRYKATLRGIHYQLPPKAETKVVRCIKGSAWDLILDLRKDSETFGKWSGEEITAENRKAMYVPKGFGHAFITLQDDTEILYLTTEYYSSCHERIVRWDDPTFAIRWPLKPLVMSNKDKTAADFSEDYHLSPSVSST